MPGEDAPLTVVERALVRALVAAIVRRSVLSTAVTGESKSMTSLDAGNVLSAEGVPAGGNDSRNT
jgi:hypothetical protein